MAGFIDALRAFFSPAPAFGPPMVDWPDGRAPLGRVVMGGMAERGGLTFEQVWGSGTEGQFAGNAAGVVVDTDAALRSIVFQAGVRLLVNDIGSLPVDAFRKVDNNETKELTKPTWVIEPNPLNPNVTWEDHVKQVVFSVLTDGNAFTRCYPNTMKPESIEVVDPATIDIEVFHGSAVYKVRGQSNALTPAEILHIPWFLRPGNPRGLNPIAAAKEGLGIALAADQFVGSYFGNGAVLSGWLQIPAGASLTTEQIQDMLDGFKRRHVGKRKNHAVGALTDGAEFQAFDYNNRDAQLLELRDQIVEEVARLLGIPPFMLGSQKPGAVGYNSVEQRSIDYVTHGILPIVKRIEAGYSRLLRGQKTYLRFNMNGLLRGDQAARAAFYDSLLQNRVMRPAEARDLEDLPFDPENVGYLETPNNTRPDPAPAAQEPPPAQEPAA